MTISAKPIRPGETPVFCFISPHYYREKIGGSEIQCYHLGQELLRRGWKVHYVHESSGKQPQQTKIDHIFLHPIPVVRALQKQQNQELIAKIIDEINPQICYLRGDVGYLPVLAKILKGSSIQLVWSCSSDEQLRLFRLATEYRIGWIYRSLQRQIRFILALRRGVTVIAQNRFQQKRLSRWTGHSVNIVSNGIPDQVASTSHRQNLVLWIGRYHFLKRPQLFLNIAQQCERIDLRFLLIAATANPQVRQQIGQNAENIAALHVQEDCSRQQVQEWLAKARFLINTSITEGFSNTFLEAWMAGVPVISFSSDPDRLLTKGKLGWLVDSTTEACEVIEKSLSDTDEWRDYSQRCRQYCLQHFSIEKVTDQFLDICRQK